MRSPVVRPQPASAIDEQRVRRTTGIAGGTTAAGHRLRCSGSHKGACR